MRKRALSEIAPPTAASPDTVSNELTEKEPCAVNSRLGLAEMKLIAPPVALRP